MTINFNPYDVLSSAFGSHEVFVPWQLPEPLLGEPLEQLEDQVARPWPFKTISAPLAVSDNPLDHLHNSPGQEFDVRTGPNLDALLAKDTRGHKLLDQEVHFKPMVSPGQCYRHNATGH